MTAKEMLQMRVEGATYQQIADVCGVSRQSVHQSVKNYADKVLKGRRGKGFCYEDIKYQGIYEHFAENEKESIHSFTVAIFGGDYGSKCATMRNFLTGKNNSYFTVSQIKRMCEICGKPFEEVFKERKGGESDDL